MADGLWAQPAQSPGRGLKEGLVGKLFLNPHKRGSPHLTFRPKLELT